MYGNFEKYLSKCKNMNTISNDSDVFNTSDDNNFTLSGLNEGFYNISVASHFLNGVISVLTIIFNSIVLICLITHRKKIPTVIFRQTLYLSVTDLLAGLIPLTLLLSLSETINQSASACILLYVAFTVVQLAVLLNLCILSLRRWIVLRRAEQPTANLGQNSKSSFLYVIYPWLISFLCHFPIVAVRIITSERQSTNGCLSPNLFENRKSYFALGTLFVGVLFLLTVFHVRSMIALKTLEKTNVITFESRRLKLQRKAFKHLLIVMVVANATTFPLLAAFFLINIEMEKDPERLFIAVQLQSLNSLFNPILYSTNVSELRSAIGENFTSILHRIGAMFGRNRES